MSGFPVVIDGASIDALVVGGGTVAGRKVRALLAAGARVRVVAPEISDDLQALARVDSRCVLVERRYVAADLEGATMIIAATDRRDVNAQIASDAHLLPPPRLVNVADDPTRGNFVTAAVHRAGELVIAVTTGGTPAAAARIRDAIADRFDERYARALAALADLRRHYLGAGDRDGWRDVTAAVLDERFCARVDDGRFAEDLAAWH